MSAGTPGPYRSVKYALSLALRVDVKKTKIIDFCLVAHTHGNIDISCNDLFWWQENIDI